MSTMKAGDTVVEVPERNEPAPDGRCRLQAAGHRVDDSTWSVQLVIEETEDGCWELHSLGAPRVRLTHPATAEVATSLLRCAHR